MLYWFLDSSFNFDSSKVSVLICGVLLQCTLIEIIAKNCIYLFDLVILLVLRLKMLYFLIMGSHFLSKIFDFDWFWEVGLRVVDWKMHYFGRLTIFLQEKDDFDCFWCACFIYERNCIIFPIRNVHFLLKKVKRWVVW